jgi:hypothetical protein
MVRGETVSDSIYSWLPLRHWHRQVGRATHGSAHLRKRGKRPDEDRRGERGNVWGGGVAVQACTCGDELLVAASNAVSCCPLHGEGLAARWQQPMLAHTSFGRVSCMLLPCPYIRARWQQRGVACSQAARACASACSRGENWGCFD